jgi:hypothetical protein
LSPFSSLSPFSLSFSLSSMRQMLIDSGIPFDVSLLLQRQVYSITSAMACSVAVAELPVCHAHSFLYSQCSSWWLTMAFLLSSAFVVCMWSHHGVLGVFSAGCCWAHLLEPQNLKLKQSSNVSCLTCQPFTLTPCILAWTRKWLTCQECW